MKRTIGVHCHYPGCTKTGFYEYHNNKDAIAGANNRESWVCARHMDPESLMSPTSLTREKSLVSEAGEGAVGHKYWNRCGVIHGPGFKAYADDFPVGTKITVTARIELPSTKPASSGYLD